jgi:hypothetical protein
MAQIRLSRESAAVLSSAEYLDDELLDCLLEIEAKYGDLSKSLR